MYALQHEPRDQVAFDHGRHYPTRPPVHVHHNEDEVIHVIEGGYEFWLDGEVVPVAAGASIFLPRGVPHTFRVISPGPGRNLTTPDPRRAGGILR
ncbi:cupin domain-containing protein [Mesorhizobium sp.]|uniref:cupin domain-containing protein n=1 Tax=Mesorhizobium sp. TaxID=1871066 RepID=UPI0025D7760C|nr:cupin domain-containing protein [Mesorhizobium sp.]